MVKLFIWELGSDKMALFSNAEDDRTKIVSVLTHIEASSAICRLRKAKMLTPPDATLALGLLAGDISRIVEQPVTPAVIQVAAVMIDRHYLRALDAVQLASAIVIRDLMNVPDMKFIALDRTLLEAAHLEGFDTWNPED